MNKCTPITLKLLIEIGMRRNGYVFTKEAIENACKNACDLPIVEYGHDTTIVGCVTDMKLENDSIIANGIQWKELGEGARAVKYTIENNNFQLKTVGVCPIPPEIRGVK